MSVDNLLQHLEKCKSTGPEKWMAACPAHEDRSASLSIRELDDGRILLHCFAGCSIHEVVAAVGLELSDLFPRRDDAVQFKKGERRMFPAADVLRAIAGEAQLVYLCAQAVHKGDVLTEADLARLLLAASHIQSALTASGARHE
jgi:hypothetical protein